MKKNSVNAKLVFSRLNFPLLIIMIAFSIFGLLMIFSASSVAAVLRYEVPTNYFFVRQGIWIILSFIIGIGILFVPTKKYRFFSRIAIIGLLILLSCIFFAGVAAGGATSWYDMGRMKFQPMEFAKPFLIIYLAVYYHRIASKKNILLIDMIFPLIISAIICVLVLLQPDFGGAFIIFLITLLIFISLPIAKKHKKTIYKLFLLGLVFLGASLMLFGKDLLHGYQISRILNFTNPCQKYSEDTGYQVCNGYIAIHNGGLTGVSLGNSTQKYLYLPEAHTDFIYPIIVEECGLIGGVLVVIFYFIMLILILNIAKETDNLRNSILAYGIFAYLVCHILVNLLGVLGLIPLTGVPLPFLSYGGSYNLCVITSLFIVQRINIENKEAKLRRKIERL